jgi:hypothetical protein
MNGLAGARSRSNWSVNTDAHGRLLPSVAPLRGRRLGSR